MKSNLTFHQGAVQTKLKLAEQVLALSNHIIQLTIEILMSGARDTDRLLKQQIEDSSKIRQTVRDIAARLESKRERELFAAASERWSSAYRYEQSLHTLLELRSAKQTDSTSAEIVLPLLLDNASWRAFIEFLHSDLNGSENDGDRRGEIATQATELVRSNQELRSKIAERKRIEDRLSQLTSIIESSRDAIITHTLAGTIVGWNQGAEALYGYSANEILGKPGKVLLLPDHIHELSEALQAVRFGDPVQPYETVHCRKDGGRINVSTAMSVVKDASDKIVAAAAITRETGIRNRSNAAAEVLNA